MVHPSQNVQVDDPEWGWWDCVPPSWIDAYAQAIAQGVQIQGYAWAYNVCAGDNVDPSAAIASDSDGSFTLFNVLAAGACYPYMLVDLKPKFYARVDVNAPGSAGASGMMHEYVPELGADLTIIGEVSSDGGVNNSTWGLTILSFGGSITTTGGIGGGKIEKCFKATQHKEAAIGMATARYDCTVGVNATADSEGDWFDAAEAEAWVWDSWAGIDLHGNCPLTCVGYEYVVYNWY
jgi:hypothetical protein